MELSYKPDFGRAAKYWDAFWHREILDRPVVCVTSPLEGVRRAERPQYMAGADGRFEDALEAFDAWASTTYFGGEAIPVFEPTFGPDQFSAFLGAALVTADDLHTSWVRPFVEDWGAVRLELSADNPVWKRMLDFVRLAARYAAGKFLVAALDTHSNMDCLSAIRGPERLCLDLYDVPDEVEKALERVRALYAPVYDGVYEAGGMAATGTTSWIPLYSEGRFAALQCDFQCMIGPDEERRFVLPALEDEASRLDRSAFHLDGAGALRHLDDILALEAVDVIQWVPGAGMPGTAGWIELLRKIQKAGKGLWLYDWSVDDIRRYYRELSPEGLCFSLEVASPKEADDLLAWFRKNT